MGGHVEDGVWGASLICDARECQERLLRRRAGACGRAGGADGVVGGILKVRVRAQGLLRGIRGGELSGSGSFRSAKETSRVVIEGVP